MGKRHSTLEHGFDDITAVLPLPERYRKRLRTTNSVERLNEEIRRLDRVIRIYPDRVTASLCSNVELQWGGQRAPGSRDVSDATSKR